MRPGPEAVGGLDILVCTETPATGACYAIASTSWETYVVFYKAIIPYVPTESPTLGHLVYEMILAYFLAHDRQVSPFVYH